MSERASRIHTFEDGSKSFDYRVTHYGRQGKVEKFTPYTVEFLGDTKYFADVNGVYNPDGTAAPEHIRKQIEEKRAVHTAAQAAKK